MSVNFRRILFWVLVFCSVSAQAQPIETLHLRYRTADEIMPLLRPFMEPGGVMSGHGNQIFIRTSTRNRQQIEHMVAQLDRAPRQLVISVRQDRAQDRVERAVRADGTVVISNHTVRGFGSLSAQEGQSIGTRNLEQTIRVIEGGVATLTMGRAVPFSFYRWLPQPNGGWLQTQETVYYEALSGFQVRPQLAGELVTLEISPQQSRWEGSRLEHARLSTQVQARLGQWVALGSAHISEHTEGGGLLSAEQRGRSTHSGVWLKVEISE